MSKISRIRILNLSYNHDSIKIDDETFDFGGESTLISLRNGGGKSVLVQMIVSLFVNKTYRDFADREFKSYFTTNRPTFIMTEWQLDNNSNERFIAGMMVRKNQRDDNVDEDLEMYTFTGSYSRGCRYDLDNIPLIRVEGNKKVLKGFSECKNVLEEISREKNGDFRIYDMASKYSRSQYYSILKQFQINNKEWESIIRKVNQKESGLSDLFNNSKDEKNLVENWFLKPIEDKLNQDKNKIDEFRSLTFKFIEQYRSNQSRIERKVIIEKYFEDTVLLKSDIDKYIGKQKEKNELTAQMVIYIRMLKETIEKIATEISGKKEEVSEISADLKRITFEQISYLVYEYQDEKQEIVAERCEQEVEITRLTNAINKLKRQLVVYDCNRIYEDIRDMKSEKAEVDEKIDVLIKESENTKDEVEEIKYKLYTFYNNDAENNSLVCKQKEDEYNKTSELKKKAQEERKDNSDRIIECNKNIGKLENAVFGYDEIEDTFNKEYHCEIKRNIIGLYQEGFLDVKRKEMEAQTQEEKSKLVRLSKRSTELDMKLRNLEQEERDNITLINDSKHAIDSYSKELAKLEGEREYRRKVIRYIGMEKYDIDNKVLILDSLARKIEELNVLKVSFVTQKAEVEKQYNRLKEGKTIELPANVQEYFEQNGIETVYGMEWLTKNGRNSGENAELVAKNPFIPYSIIMEKDTFERLKGIDEELYTSFPIPVIIRGDLEKCVGNTENHVTTYGNVHFFIMFNDNLLNEDELEKILGNLKNTITGIEKQIADKDADIETFSKYRLNIEEQTYSSSLYAKTEKDIEAAKNKMVGLEERQKEIKKEKADNVREHAENRGFIEDSKQLLNSFEKRKIDFDKLCVKYCTYESDKTSLSREKNELSDLAKKQKEYDVRIEELERETNALADFIRQCEESIEGARSKAAQYEIFADSKFQNIDNITDRFEADKLEAKYNALTNEISETMEELKKRQKKLNDNIKKKISELSKKNKNNIPEEEYRDIMFTDEQYDTTETQIKNTETALNTANEKNTRYAEQIATLKTSIEYEMKQLMNETGNEELAPRQTIVDTDFEKRKRLRKHDETVVSKDLKLYEDRKNELNVMLSGVAEYADDKIDVSDEKLSIIKSDIPDLENAEKSALEKYQMNLRKKLRIVKDELVDCRSGLSEEIMAISTKEEYSDDYFKKTLTSLLSQIDNPFSLAEQYEVNKASYESQLEKLKIDLESIDKEQKNIEEMFLEYIQNINANVAMIDKNSTINVRNRSIKMLRIQVPDWESEKEHFKLRLHDFFEKVIKHGLQAIEDNKNLNEFLGNVISTKKLYDDVVGINNIKIKLYKIEAEREVPITWAEVSANSGGEGFLSAFVILTCLLSYMRRDENDMFTSGEEGKVLIMDNPFAQTYSAHLLKPLMEMAKKTNTQLICLSGLGGDSIYNRFDNIYVVKLIDSNIRNGMQRVENTHIKGESVKKMVLSDFKTEQMSLFDMMEEE